MIAAQLLAIMPFAKKRISLFIDHINFTLAEQEINTPLRVAAYLAQIAHESGELRYTEEIASGKAYDTGRLAARLGNSPEADGDGQRWKGHGLIQITGLDNHEACAEYFGIPLDEIAAWLVTPEGATRSSGWFWAKNGLNLLADQGRFEKITRVINGGVNGLADRLKYYKTALKVLGA